MAIDAPDWVRQVVISVIVENVPVPPDAANQVAAGGKGRYTGTDTTYQAVVTWTVTAAKVGELKEILIISDLYAKTLLKVTVGSVTWATDWAIQSSMPIIFEDLKLAAASVIKVEAKSSDGTSITVDAIIVGKEVG